MEKMEVEQIDLSALEIRDEKPQAEESPSALPEIAIGETPVIRRSGRRKIRPLEVVKETAQNRRSFGKPKKLDLNKENSIKAVEAYYLSKKFRLTTPTLETIYEEPKQDVVFSTRKLRRAINFGETTQKPDKSKVKKRSVKAKKVIKGGFKKLGKKIGLALLMKKLKALDSGDDD